MLLLMILLSVLVRCSRASYCPSECRCISASKTAGDLEVSCGNKELIRVPELPAGTVSLDLSKNKLRKIPANVFANLKNLKSLWIDNNKINEIESFAFRGVRDYEVISIRNNQPHLEHLTKNSFSGLHHIRNLLLTNNNISRIDKNAFFGTSNIDLLALYGNPLRELRPEIFNNLRHVRLLRLPIGIKNIIPRAFSGLSEVLELSLEGMNLQSLKADTFANLTNVVHLRIHDSTLHHISPRAFARVENITSLTFSFCNISSINADMFDGAEMFHRLYFDRNHFSKVQLDFPQALTSAAHMVVWEGNDADCCAIKQHNLKVWKNMASKFKVINEFLHDVHCRTPHWVFEESLFVVDLETLRMACDGTLAKNLKETLEKRLKEKPELSVLYRLRNSAVANLNDSLPKYMYFLFYFILVCIHSISS